MQVNRLEAYHNYRKRDCGKLSFACQQKTVPMESIGTVSFLAPQGRFERPTPALGGVILG